VSSRSAVAMAAQVRVLKSLIGDTRGATVQDDFGVAAEDDTRCRKPLGSAWSLSGPEPGEITDEMMLAGWHHGANVTRVAAVTQKSGLVC